jgi:hypothetical protein
MLDLVARPTVDERPALMAIDARLLPTLQRLLDRTDRADPFVRSAAYFAMTGRNGLWLYGDDATAMLMARHPNRADRLLLFPPFGRNPAGLVAKALSDPRLPEGSPQLARLGPEDATLKERFGGAARTEDVLDWVCPVHVISTKALIERKGGAFNNLRAHLNKAARAGLRAEPASPLLQSDIMRVVEAWASRADKPGYSYEDLTGPTKACLKLMDVPGSTVTGLVVYEGEAPMGFWLWDEAGRERGIAASLVRVSIGRHGAAEFAAAKMAEILDSRGISEMCLGGSETASLDAFKRKLGPVRSIELDSAFGLTRAALPALRSVA